MSSPLCPPAIASMPTSQLKSIIATLSPTGAFCKQVYWAKDELDKRGVDYSDCLSPVEDSKP